jgi:hypothetical protein
MSKTNEIIIGMDYKCYIKQNKKHKKRLARKLKSRLKGKRNDNPKCPRCKGKAWKHTSSTDEHDTYHMMKCDYCNFSYSGTHD